MRSSATIGGESEPSTCRRSFSVWCATRTITRSGACRPTFPWYGSRGEDDRCLLHPTGTGHFTLRSPQRRSEEHTSELQSLMSISYAVFCLINTKHNTPRPYHYLN